MKTIFPILWPKWKQQNNSCLRNSPPVKYTKVNVVYLCLHTHHKTKDAPSKPNAMIPWLQFRDCSHLFQALNAGA